MSKRLRISNAQFFAICNEMQTHREVLVKECKTKEAVVAFIKDRLGIEAGINSISTALGTVGIKLDRRPWTSKKSNYSNARVLAGELLRLYRKLGEEPSDSLVAMAKQPPVDG